MIGHELAVQQGETAKTHASGQPGERHLRRVGAPRHHAFPEKRPSERDAIQAADQFLPLPHLNGVGETNLMQMTISPLDRMIDPGGGSIRRGFGAEPHYGGKIAIGGHPETLPPDRLGQ